MKKSKVSEINSFYKMQDEKKNKVTKRENKKKNQKRNKTPNESIKDDIFNFDNEIVIGVTPKKQENEKNKKKKNKLNNNSPKKSNKTNKNIKKQENKQKDLKNKISPKEAKKIKKRKRVISIIKWLVIVGATITAIVFFLLSPIFNLEKIEVVNNEIIPEATYISLSQITLGQNIYKINKTEVRNKIKENNYVEDVLVERILPTTIRLTVTERKPTYMLEIDQNYMYINNQGYMLELTNQRINTPIIAGYKTKQEDIQNGNRLVKEDLTKLETVLKITEAASSNDLYDKIQIINIEDANNYTLILTDGKIVYLGESTELNRRMSLLKMILKQEEGKQGEVFIDGDMNQKKGYFREKI